MERLRTARTRIVLLATVGVLVTALAGCARPVTAANADALPGGPADSFGDGRAAMPVGVDCESDSMAATTPPPMTPLAADAVLVSARRCLFEPELVAGDGEWLMRFEQEATSGLEALATALRLPSEDKPPGTACRAIGYVQIVITVTDAAGRSILPKVPATACGAPLQAATDAIAALSWTNVATTRVRQMRSELEISSGCSSSWKPVIALTAAEGSGSQTWPVDTTARPLRVCRYDLDPDPANAIPIYDGTPYRLGVLVSASTLDASAAASLLTALSAAPRAVGQCGQPEHPFAVVSTPEGAGPWAAIELGGCHRASLDGENYVRQLDAATVAPLLS